MIQLIVCTHGRLAESFVDTVGMIVGPQTASQISAIGMMPEDEPEAFEARARAILEAHPDDQFLICADLFGASPCNTCISVFRSADYRLITGVNLPLLIELIMNKDTSSLEELWENAQKEGRDGIQGIYLHT